MIEHELHVCKYVDGKLQNWLALQDNPVRIKQMDEVIWSGEAHELCALIEHLRAENTRLEKRENEIWDEVAKACGGGEWNESPIELVIKQTDEIERLEAENAQLRKVMSNA